MLGDSLRLTVQVNPDATDEPDMLNNQSECILIIQGAYDPNDKQGPAFITPAQVAEGHFLYYTIRFQNTGTDTAFTVVVMDTLDMKLQTATLEWLSSSHSCHVEQEGQIVSFTFDNILLPDSNTNLIASCGYVSFRIKPQPTLEEGEVIPNKAEIYFDYNAPVVTNTVQTTVALPGRITPVLPGNYLSDQFYVYPNPVENGVIYLSGNMRYTIYDQHGLLVKTGLAESQPVSVSSLPAGLYFIEMSDANTRSVQKILVK